MPPTNQPIMPIGGRMGFFDEDFERESIKIPDSIQGAFESAPKFILDPTIDIAKETVGAVKELFTIFTIGSIDFQKPKTETPEDKKKKEQAMNQRSFYQAMESGRKDYQHTTFERSMEEAARLTVAAMSTEDKNKTLKLNSSLNKAYTQNPYHIHTLRRIKLDELKSMQQQKQSQELAASGKGLLNNMNAHEGQSMTSSSGAIMSAG